MPLNLKILRGAPTPPVGFRLDSSTGLGQIFASTAIAATNWYYGKKVYDSTNWKDLRTVWTSLNGNNVYNIDMVGRVLAYKRSSITKPTPKTIMQAYNGTGELAKNMVKLLIIIIWHFVSTI